VRSLIMLSLLVFIVFLNGCVRHLEIQHGLTPDQIGGNNSIVILSTGAKTTRHSSILHIRRIEDGKFVYGLLLNNPFVASHFNDHYGNLHILTFKPGKYFFSLISNVPLSWYEKPSSFFVFEVKESEVVYIGEVFFEFIEAGGLLNPSPGYAKLIINDKFERDIGIFLEKNPSFKVQDIRKRGPYSIRLSDTTGISLRTPFYEGFWGLKIGHSLPCQIRLLTELGLLGRLLSGHDLFR